MPRETPEAVLQSIVDGINTGDLDSLMTLYEPDAVFATQPGKLTNGFPGIREALSNFVAAKGTFDLKVTRVLKGGDLALVTGEWSLVGTGPDGQPMKLAAKSADVLRRQKDGTWRFVIDNPWGTD
jgi:uncharacterized protein (TIGR02246 family)